MTIKTRELQRQVELNGAENTAKHLADALLQGDIKPGDFSLRGLAESFLPGGLAQIEQATTPISMAISFVNSVGAVIDSAIKGAYSQGIFAASKLVRTIPTRLNGEKIFTVGTVAENNLAVTAGNSYSTANIHAGYVETPTTTKHGLIIPLTKEAIFFDQTHQLLACAAQVGEILALNKEKRILDTILGITHSCKLNGSIQDTYSTGESAHPWKNLLIDNELLDWQNIEAAENMFDEMRELAGSPLVVEPNTVLVMPPKRHLAYRLFGNLPVDYKVISSGLAYQRLKTQPGMENTEKVWLIGDFHKAFAYMENWGITVTCSTPGDDADFTKDIAIRFKASERGTPAVIDPRYVVKCTG